MAHAAARASRSVLIVGMISFWLSFHQSARAMVDTNDNGVSDVWEELHNHGYLYSTFDPDADPDGDGWTNAEEAAAGTNPHDANPPVGIIRPEIERFSAVYGPPE